MKPELREQLGKAVYAEESKERKERTGIDTIEWEDISEISKELRRREGESAVSSFVQMIMPGINNFLDTINPMLTNEQKQQLAGAVDIIKSAVGEE